MIDLCRRIATHPWFQNAILVVTLVNAAVIGLEASSAARAAAGMVRLQVLEALRRCMIVEKLRSAREAIRRAEESWLDDAADFRSWVHAGSKPGYTRS